MEPYNKIPRELRERRQWVCWRYDSRGGDKPTKVPTTIGGYDASSTNPRDWYSFEEVVEHAHEFDGIGFVFTKDDPYCGIDLDDCLVDGEPKQWAKEIAEKFATTYGEVSPSGNGIKYICKATNPLVRGRKVACGDGAIEIYDRGRFFTVTGNLCGEDDVAHRQAEIDWLIESFMPASDPKGNLEGVMRPRIYVGDDEKLRRASAYLAEVEPAISGSGGHDTTYRAACSLVVGFDLSADDAFGLLWNEYNPRCSPPWSEKEIWHKVWSAEKADGERGKLLEDWKTAGVDLSLLLGEERTTDFDDEDFAKSMVPAYGLLRDIYDFYGQQAQRLSHVMGLAVAVSTCEVMFGRRIASHTDLRTNDYNVIVAPTNCGKEACEKTVSKIFEAVNPEHQYIIPPDVQSGNGLVSAINVSRCCIWVSDEFGKVLAAVLDKKNRNPHQTQIATHLLKLYGKADGIYGGAAHSGGVRNRIVQPHFCVLGLTTGSTLFESVDASNVSDGLFGRIAFWPVQDRPRRRRMKKVDVPAELIDKVAHWMAWQPIGNLGAEYPAPAVLEMSSEALARWESHSEAIDERMDEESETRNAIWGRVAARSMKLAMVHRAARETGDPGAIAWEFVEIELIDIEWGIKVSNWLARIACQLISENFRDRTTDQLCDIIEQSIGLGGEVSTRDITRAYRRFSSGDVMAAARKLEASGKVVIERKNSAGRGRPSWVVRSILSAI
jgi:hypothetical protein